MGTACVCSRGLLIKWTGEPEGHCHRCEIVLGEVDDPVHVRNASLTVQEANVSVYSSTWWRGKGSKKGMRVLWKSRGQYCRLDCQVLRVCDPTAEWLSGVAEVILCC